MRAKSCADSPAAPSTGRQTKSLFRGVGGVTAAGALPRLRAARYTARVRPPPMGWLT